MLERWKHIPFAPGYEASTHGRVRSSKGLETKVLRQQSRERLHTRVCLCLDGKGRGFPVKDIIFRTFNYDIPAGHVVIHIDKDIRNNFLDNLGITLRSAMNWSRRRVITTHDVTLAMRLVGLEDPSTPTLVFDSCSQRGKIRLLASRDECMRIMQFFGNMLTVRLETSCNYRMHINQGRLLEWRLPSASDG